MKKEMLKHIKEIYEKNENIMRFLRMSEKRTQNTVEDIMISYDFQAGTYINDWNNRGGTKRSLMLEIAGILDAYMEKLNLEDRKMKIMEAGIGEGTSMFDIMSNLKHKKPKEIYGFDISWSRAMYARRFLEEREMTTKIFLGDLLNIPISNSAMDVVYTSHAIEPNGGKEREILEELYRITKRYLILIEPIYELASPEAQVWMEEHGYVKSLYDTSKQLGYKVLEYRLLDNTSNILNPSGVLVIEKDPEETINEKMWMCPVSKKRIDYFSPDSCWCSDSLLMYPVIDKIPCLLDEYAILACSYGIFHDMEK